MNLPSKLCMENEVFVIFWSYDQKIIRPSYRKSQIFWTYLAKNCDSSKSAYQKGLQNLLKETSTSKTWEWDDEFQISSPILKEGPKFESFKLRHKILKSILKRQIMKDFNPLPVKLNSSLKGIRPLQGLIILTHDLMTVCR